MRPKTILSFPNYLFFGAYSGFVCYLFVFMAELLSLLSKNRPLVMGILNVTPDSFSDGGKFNAVDAALRHTDAMLAEGADIIDVGGESTRPGSDPVSEVVELERTIPAIEAIIQRFPGAYLSIDTTKFAVARAALEAGASMINDVSGLQREPRLAELAAQFRADLVIMHSRGNPKTMQKAPVYADVQAEVRNFFVRQVALAGRFGVQPEHIVLDPGIGFGKTLAHNMDLLRGLETSAIGHHALLVGASRKSMIGALLDERPADGRLAGTLAVHFFALMKGARLLRVHDVQACVDQVRIFCHLHNKD